MTDPDSPDGLAGPVRVRLARPSDLRHLRGVEEAGVALFRAHLGDRVLAAVPALTATPPSGSERDLAPGFLLVADRAGLAGRLVGFAHVTTAAVQEDVAHLEQLSVLPDHGRRGIGTRLVEAAAEEARWAGYAALALCTYRDLPWNGPFYARLGFTEVARPSAYQQDLRARERAVGLDDAGARVVMARRLGGPLRR